MAQASGVEKARFESLDGGGTFTVQFNPKELKLDEKASWKASDEHGEDEPQLTYEKGEPTSLSMELIFDTSDTKKNVNTEFIVPLRGFMTAQYEDTEAKDATGGGSNKRPCYAKFIWGGFEFDGVVEKVNSTFLMFDTGGTPIRAKVQIGMKERKRPDHAIGAGGGVTLAAGAIVVGGGAGGSVEAEVKVYTTKEGDTPDKVAAKTGAESRNIMDANGVDPIELEPGTKLVIPMTKRMADVLKRRRRNEPKRNYKNNPPSDPFDESRNVIRNDPGPSALEESNPVAMGYDSEVGDFANAYISFGPEYESGPIDSEGSIGEYGATGAGDGLGDHASNGANPIGEGMGASEAMGGDREVGDGAVGEFGATGAGDGVGNHATNGANPTGEGMGATEAMGGDREVGDGAIGEFGATGAGDGVGAHTQGGADPTADGMGSSAPMGGDQEVGDGAIGEFGATGAGDGEGAHTQGGANPTGEGMGASEAMGGDREVGDGSVGEYGARGAGDGVGDHSQGGADPTGEGMGRGAAMGGDREAGDLAAGRDGARGAGGAGGADGGGASRDEMRASAGGTRDGEGGMGSNMRDADRQAGGAGGDHSGGAAVGPEGAAGSGEDGRPGQAGEIDVDTDKMREDNQERDAQPSRGGGRQGGADGDGGPGGRGGAGGAGGRGEAEGNFKRAGGEGAPGSREEVAERVADRAEAKTGERPETQEEVKKAGNAMGLGEVIRQAKQNAKDNPGE